ncbi:MAG: ComEC family competence protein [Chitinophagia bacterium]|nr:ComEC family competence protein [Chitinophagia bacterium]
MPRWPRYNDWFWERAPFFRIVVPLAAGIAVYEAWASFPLIVASLLAATCLLGICLLVGLGRVNQWLFLVLLNVGFSAVGYSLAAGNDDRADVAHLTAAPGTAWLVRVTTPPAKHTATTKMQVRVLGALGEHGFQPHHFDMLVYLFADGAPAMYWPGDTLLLPGATQPIINRGNPHEFDFAAYCRRNHIYTQLVCSANNIRMWGAATAADQSLPERLRYWCNATLRRLVTDKVTYGLMQAMLTGGDIQLSPEWLETFTQTGIVHILVVSGGNIALLFSLLVLSVRWVKHKKYQWIKYLAALPAIWIYVMIAGGDVSPVRAGVMFTLMAIGLAFQKNKNPINELLATAFVLLVLQPSWLFHIGFQLSFLAVLGLIVYQPAIAGLWKPKFKFVRWLWQALAASVAAELMVAPLVAYYFHSFPLVFLPANLLALALVVVQSYGAIAVLCLSWCEPAARWLGWFLGRVNATLLHLLRQLQQLQPAAFNRIYCGLAVLLLVMAVVGCVAQSIRRQQGRWLLAAIACLAAAVTLSVGHTWQATLARRLVVYSVSRGIYAEYIHGRTATLLIADSLGAVSARFAAREAHICWETPFTDTSGPARAFTIGEQSIAFTPNRPVNGSFPADVVVVTHPAATHPTDVIGTFHPSVIVLSNNATQTERHQWDTACSRNHIQLHQTGRDGAWIMESW